MRYIKIIGLILLAFLLIWIPTAKRASEPRIIELTDVDMFDELVLQADGLIVVDFYADWCPPCKDFAPIMDDLSAHHRNVTFCKVHIDYTQIDERYGITWIPELVFFRDGKDFYWYKGDLLFKDVSDQIDSLKINR